MVLSASSYGLHHSIGNCVCDACSTKFNENMSATMQLLFVDWLHKLFYGWARLHLSWTSKKKETTQHSMMIYMYIPLQANMKTSVCFKPTSNATNTATVNRHFEKWSARLRASQRYTASSQVFTVNWPLTVVDSWPEIRNSLVKTTNSARHQLKAFPFLKGGDRLIGNDGDACVWILRSAVPLALQPLHKIVLETRTVQNFRVNTVAHPSISSREPWEIYKRVVRWTQRPVTWSMASCRSGLCRLYMYGYFSAVSLVFVGYLVSLTGQSSLFVLKSSSLSKVVDSTTNSIEF